MTREEEIKQAAEETLRREGYHAAVHEFMDGARWADKNPINPWHKTSEELPPVDTEVVCKMKGVPHTEHFICKWDGRYWWHWNYIVDEAQGWFGLNKGWEVIEWKEI